MIVIWYEYKTNITTWLQTWQIYIFTLNWNPYLTSRPHGSCFHHWAAGPCSSVGSGTQMWCWCSSLWPHLSHYCVWCLRTWYRYHLRPAEGKNKSGKQCSWGQTDRQSDDWKHLPKVNWVTLKSKMVVMTLQVTMTEVLGNLIGWQTIQPSPKAFNMELRFPKPTYNLQKQQSESSDSALSNRPLTQMKQ